MFWSSPFSSFYGNLPDVFNASRDDDRDSEDQANQSWTFGKKSPAKAEKKWSPASKPATPTSLRVIPRKKVSTLLRGHHTLPSDDDDGGFEYLARRPFPTEALYSIPAEILLSDNRVRDDTVLSTASESSVACMPENLPPDVHRDPVLDLRYMKREALPSCDSSVLFLSNNLILESPLDAAVPDFLEAVPSPEISPFRTFATTKASLGYDVTKPDVSIPDVRRSDGSKCEDHNESKSHTRHEDAEKNTEIADYSGYYEEDMVLETDSESTSSVFGFETPAVSDSPDLSGLSVSWDEHEHGDIIKDEDTEDLVLETDMAIPASRPTIPRLNPDAPPFIPRFSFSLSPTPTPVPVPAAEVQLPSSVSGSHVDKAKSAIKHEDESTCDIVHSLWPAETKDADDIAFLMYFGLLDLVSP